MPKPLTKFLLPLLFMLFLALGACNTVTIRPAAEVTAEFEAAVAQTLAARDTATPVPSPTSTITPSVTPTATITETLSPTPVPPTTVVDTYCDNSAFLGDITITDGTLLAPGQVFEKTWSFQNTGLCTWNQGYTIAWVSGDAMKGTTRPLSQSVPPNGTIDVTVKLTAPFNPGEYRGIWRLTNSKGEQLGDFVSVVIVVAGPGTPIPTSTP